ncbi:hypothetical protein ACC736_37690, partial [Rhizobium ruizarguesonis]
ADFATLFNPSGCSAGVPVNPAFKFCLSLMSGTFLKLARDLKLARGGKFNPPNLAALREASREHTDAFLVKTDLEDADQREASPGTREQD